MHHRATYRRVVAAALVFFLPSSLSPFISYRIYIRIGLYDTHVRIWIRNLIQTERVINPQRDIVIAYN